MRSFRLSLISFVLMMLAGCGTLPNGHLWGEDATLRPGWQRVEDAARDAALAPQTWAPLAGAVVFRATDWDQRLSDWAVDHHPLFGSSGRASDGLVYSAAALYGVTALAAPDGDQPQPWLISKLKGGLVGGAAVLSALGTTEVVKDLAHRPRPDRSDHKSFPSGHATGAAALATLTSRNLDVLELTQTERTAARIGLGGLVAATCWARIEEGKHYPSDVLTGAAVGYFFSAVINDAFLGLDAGAPLHASLDLSRRGALVGVTWSY